MSRTGSNGGGKGGRDHRLNWTVEADGSRVFGHWSVQRLYPDTLRQWTPHYKGMPMFARHGAFSGHRRFKTPENAQRWVEKHLAQKGRRR